jgi:transmembrane sensor
LKLNENHIDDELLVKYILGEATEGEKTAVDRWVALRPENKKYFDHFLLIWETSKSISIPATVNAEDAWIRFQQRTQTSTKNAPVRRIGFPRRSMAAAVAVLFVGLVALGYLILGPSSQPQIVIADAKPVLDTLPDGSVVTLNRNSSLKYLGNFKGKSREVELTGEAFFSVTHNKKKPFVITVSDVTVTVVGTSFNIKNHNGTTEVVVESGVVRVTRNNKTVELRANEKISTSTLDSSFAKETSTDKLHQYYRSRQFVCNATPLWKLVEVLNEAYDANIIIRNNELRSLQLTTTFDNESLDRILSIIAETLEISVERKGNHIILQ